MKEIDSSVLISYLAQKNESKEVSISIKEIRKIGHVIEERHPSIIVDMDKYSIESFRIKSGGRVAVHGQEIRFVKTDKVIQVLLKNNQPSGKLTDLLEEIFGGKDRL